MNFYQKYVAGFEKLFLQAKESRPASVSRKQRKLPRGEEWALIFSPHPDDECIVGGLALRLQREAGMRVLNVAVTLGSKLNRRRARLAELKRACRYLGFDLVLPKAGGMENIHRESRAGNRTQWTKNCRLISQALKKYSPRVIFVPHARDGHRSHIGTHFLTMDALKMMPAGFECLVIETEFWGQMTEPNLMVELAGPDLADLVNALALHAGEVKRNAYHLRLPAWMMDNVRRAEAVGGPGCAAPEFVFATNYRLRRWRRGQLMELLPKERFLPKEMRADSILL